MCIVTAPICIPTNSVGKFPSLYYFPFLSCFVTCALFGHITHPHVFQLCGASFNYPGTNHIYLSLSTKVHLVRAMVFPVVMYECESWTVKKAECQRIDAFEVWCWIRLLRVPWTARSNQSILKEISPEYSLEGLMMKLKLQSFGHSM